MQQSEYSVESQDFRFEDHKTKISLQRQICLHASTFCSFYLHYNEQSNVNIDRVYALNIQTISTVK